MAGPDVSEAKVTVPLPPNMAITINPAMTRFFTKSSVTRMRIRRM